MPEYALDGGFADAPVDAARAFRALMQAMARPGRIETLATARPPVPVSRAAGTLILTLCDAEAGLHLAGRHDTQAVRDWVTFHTGAPTVAAEQAQFALGDWEALLPLSRFPIGTPEYPDRSATLIVEMPRLAAEGITLSGPGIARRAALHLPDPDAMRANAARFPLGLDFFLTCNDRVTALPRSTRVHTDGEAPCT